MIDRGYFAEILLPPDEILSWTRTLPRIRVSHKMIFLTALGKLETTVWPWSLLDHGNSFVMGIVEMDWAISPLSCRLWLSDSEIQSLFPQCGSVVRVIDTDIYLRHSWHPHVLPVTVSRALVCSQTQIRWHPIPRGATFHPACLLLFEARCSDQWSPGGAASVCHL